MTPMVQADMDINKQDKKSDNQYFITIEAPAHCSDSKDIKLRGRFKVPYGKDGITVEGAQVLKHIVMVVSRGGNYQAVTPFKDAAVFADDVNDDGKSCSGGFNINVADHLMFDGGGDYYILCSLGTYLSNITKTSVK